MILDSKRTITDSLERSIIANFSVSNLSAHISSIYSNQALLLTNTFQNELDRLTSIRSSLQNDINNNPGVNQSFRNRGVDLAWEYERLDVSMGGSGTRNYTSEQIKELLETGKVRGLEGQHINSAASHPELQGDPDNIKFLTRDEHFSEHGYDWRNQTTGELIDKDKMVSQSYRSQIQETHLEGMGISAAIGFGTGFVISTVIELSKCGNYDNIKILNLLKHSLFSGVETAAISSVSYAGGLAVNELLQNIGLDMTSKIGSFTGTFTTGLLSIAVVSAYQYTKLRSNGLEKDEAFNVVGEHISFPILSLAASTVASTLLGGPAGIIVSVASTIIHISTNVIKNDNERKIAERLREYTVEQYKPVYLQ